MIDIKIKHFLKVICVFIFITLSLSAKSQSEDVAIEDIKTKKLIGLAKNSLRLGDAYNALYFYNELSKRKSDDIEIKYTVANLLKTTRNYVEAEKWFGEIVETNLDKYPLALLEQATLQLNLEQYEKAKANFLKFKKLLRSTKLTDPIYRKKIKNGILSADFSLLMRDSTNEAVTTHLNNSINKPHIEFSPVYLDENTMIYGSLKMDTLAYYNINDHDSMNIPLRKFYLAKKKDSVWKSLGEFEGPFNQEKKHVGNACLSQDNNKLYFTICEKNWKNKTNCKLFYSIKTNNKWGKPEAMDDAINMEDYTTTQPATGFESKRNREIVYFVSDRPGGKGGLDVWYAEYNPRSKKFKTPRNAGSKINSKQDEMTPYMDPSTRTMYFSSNGKVGYGGLDVYKTTGEKGKWAVATAMGKNINSSYDDLEFILNEDKSGGLFVSNRPGGNALLNETCCDDIYEFKFTEFIKIDLDLKVSDSIECLKDYQLSLYIKGDSLKEKHLIKKIYVTDCNQNLNLDQGFEYEMEINKEGYFKQSIAFSTNEINKNTTLNKNLDLKKIPKKPIILKGILYEYNSHELTQKAKNTIDTTLFKLLITNKKIIIEIAAHTDNRGKDSYNMSLSQKRAKSVYKYLIKKGIDEQRLKYIGHGESKPIAPNDNPDGSDNKEGRRLNRRTEFTILGELKEEEE